MSSSSGIQPRINQDSRSIRKDERCDQDVTRIVAPALCPDLVPDGDLMGKIERTGRLNSPIFHACQAGRRHTAAENKRLGRLHGSQMAGEVFVQVVAFHLPEPQPERQADPEQDQQGGRPPAPGKQSTNHRNDFH